MGLPRSNLTQPLPMLHPQAAPLRGTHQVTRMQSNTRSWEEGMKSWMWLGSAHRQVGGWGQKGPVGSAGNQQTTACHSR